jgi:hypothetical protein
VKYSKEKFRKLIGAMKKSNPTDSSSSNNSDEGKMTAQFKKNVHITGNKE